MKTLILSSLTAALMTTPLMASAGHKCSSDIKYRGYGYYGPPDHYMHHHPMHHPHHHKMHKMMWYKKHKGELPPGHPMKDRHDAASQQSDGANMPEVSANQDYPAATQNIIDTAVSAGSFSTLVGAIEAAELVETLNQPGPFTVFAPTDEAFEKLPATIRTALVSDKKALAELLTYHVLPGEVTAADAARLNAATTVQGSKVTIDSTDGVVVDGARVVTADIRASNGIIHVIDSVMIPN